MRLDGSEALFKLAAAACGSGAAWFSAVSEVAVQLLGVPLPVVLGAAAGAFLARAYLPHTDDKGEPIGYFHAFFVSAGWTIAGSVAAPLVQALMPAIPGVAAISLPAGALAGLAAIVASLPAGWPKVRPLIAARMGKGGEQ